MGSDNHCQTHMNNHTYKPCPYCVLAKCGLAPLALRLYKSLSLLTLAALALCTTALADSYETLPSGVVVGQVVQGSGEAPTSTSTVKVHYRGTLANGTEFDSSYKRGEPITFKLNQVIPCWSEGLQRMKVGGKARLVCPPKTAYGERGVPGAIPPNSVLFFDVELLAIEQPWYKKLF